MNLSELNDKLSSELDRLISLYPDGAAGFDISQIMDLPVLTDEILNSGNYLYMDSLNKLMIEMGIIDISNVTDITVELFRMPDDPNAFGPIVHLVRSAA